MTCTGFEERIAHYVGGDLAADEMPAIERHLRVCSDCASLARELAEDRVWLASRPPETADVDLAAMRREIRREITRPRWSWKWIAAAAAILIALGVGITAKRTPQVERKEAVVLKEVRPERAPVSQQAARTPARKSATRGSRADVGVRPTQPESPVEIRIATRDPNVTIILLHEFKGESE
jgi:anti-sigma factor RsiW